MRRALGVLVAVVVLAAFPASASAAWRLVGVKSGFDAPVHVASTRADPGHIYVVEKGGVIWRVASGQRNTRFLDISDLVSTASEQGLLSLAFHPSYATNGKAYVYYSNASGDNEVVEFSANSTRTKLVRVTRRRLVYINHPGAANHNGGQLAFDANGHLYASVGDAADHNNAQRRSTPLGKLIRINVVDGRWSVVALGLRNPWRFFLDATTSTFWIGDVGQDRREEVDRFRIGNSILENYGWGRWEGTYLVRPWVALSAGARRDPVHEYSHANGRCSITQGPRYRGSDVPSAYGRVFFGDFCTGEVWSFAFGSRGKHDLRRHDRIRVPGMLSSFGTGPRGRLYFVSFGGSIYRLGRT